MAFRIVHRCTVLVPTGSECLAVCWLLVHGATVCVRGKLPVEYQLPATRRVKAEASAVVRVIWELAQTSARVSCSVLPIGL